VSRGQVPGEGIEPSRAEAHGFLRPARLPIPPSRPGRSSVAVRRIASGLLGLIVAGAPLGCSATPNGGGGPRIVFLFDGSADDADDVVAPALAGLRFAALGTGRPETIQPLNVGLEDALEMLDRIGEDREVIAAVVAPWTVPPPGAQERLEGSGIPVVSLSWAWGPMTAGVWRSMAVDLEREADLLVAAAAAEARRPSCVAGDTQPTSDPLTDAVLDAAADRVDLALRPVGIVDPERPATAAAVAGRLVDLGCDAVVWTGGADALEPLLDDDPELLTVVGTSRLKTEGGIGVGVSHPVRRLVAVCACADVTLTLDPRLQRFIHDFQTESGSAPGPFAVEAYDAGRLLLTLAREQGGSRGAVADALDARMTIDGLLGAYRFDAGGSLRSAPEGVGVWRASGSRWLPVPETVGGLSALPLGVLLPIVRSRRRARPGVRIVHR
jgi:hypothetical protein